MTTWTAVSWNVAEGHVNALPVRWRIKGAVAVEKIKLGDADFLLEPRREVRVTTSSFGICKHAHTVGTNYITQFLIQSQNYTK